jgi:uncharacterized surface protein with fasciclin (FAS1) repeats
LPATDAGSARRTSRTEESALTAVLLYHVAPEGRRLGDLIAGGEVETLEGSSVTVAARNRGAFVESSRVVTTDMIAPNGVIQAIDAVLLP